jgi:radical SAM superfamily enzyme YgiQ (UPF0313 family)
MTKILDFHGKMAYTEGMKVLFIQHPIRDFYRTRFREYPLGLLYMASSLRRLGFGVKVLDARRAKRPRKIPVPRGLSRAEDLFKTSAVSFPGFWHFGMAYEEIAAEASRYSPDAVVINAMFTPYSSETAATATAVRRALPSAMILMGGHHATADPESLLSCDAVDAAVCGEGEEILPQILNGRPSGIICDDSSKGPFRVAALDSLPPPARDAIDQDDYTFGGKRYAMAITSRGCPHACTFCSVHNLSGHEHRVRGIDSVMDEIDECIGEHGIHTLDLQDDNLLYDAERIKIILDGFVSRHEGTGVRLMASNGLNACHLDGELLSLMKRAGFPHLDIALVSGRVGSREAFGRPEAVERYEEVLRTAVGLGLPVTTYIIIGHPRQPLSDQLATVEYLKKMPTLISPSVFYNVPGTPAFEGLRKYEYEDSHVARRSTAFNCFGDDFSAEDIFGIFTNIRGHNLRLKGEHARRPQCISSAISAM